jgi:hypothetical protein
MAAIATNPPSTPARWFPTVRPPLLHIKRHERLVVTKKPDVKLATELQTVNNPNVGMTR